MDGAARAGLSDHTLVIPTYNRTELLERLVSYYATSAPEMKILVLDSSQGDVPQRNAAMVASRNRNARHIAYPTTIPMGEKMGVGAREVTTRTASLCADDDIIFPDAMPSAIDVVVNDKRYACAHGIYLNFAEIEKTVRIHVEYSGPSIEGHHPGARVFQLSQNYESLLYGLYRSQDFKDILAETATLSSLHYQELVQSVSALIKGRVKRLGSFYGGRRTGPVAEPTRDKWQTFYWFADNPREFIAHYAEYCEHLWQFYQRETADADAWRAVHGDETILSREEFVRVMDICHAIYFSRACPPSYFHSTLQTLWPRDTFVNDYRAIIEQRHPFGIVTGINKTAQRYYKGLERRLSGAQPSRLRPLYLWYTKTFRGKVRSLNAPQAGATNWQPEFGGGWEWLASDAGFRAAYRELSLYLDGPTTAA